MVASLSACPRLRCLRLSDARAVPPALLAALLRALPALEVLDIRGAIADADVVAAVAGLRCLTDLNLNGAAELSDESLAVLAASWGARLRRLNIVDTSVSFVGLDALLARCGALVALAIDAEPEVVAEVRSRRPDLSRGLFDYGAAKRAICAGDRAALAAATAGHEGFINTVFRARFPSLPGHTYLVSLTSLAAADGVGSGAGAVRQLLRLGADPNVGVDAHLNSPLLRYVAAGDVRMVGELLRRGARPNALSGASERTRAPPRALLDPLTPLVRRRIP